MSKIAQDRRRNTEIYRENGRYIYFKKIECLSVCLSVHPQSFVPVAKRGASKSFKIVENLLENCTPRSCSMFSNSFLFWEPKRERKRDRDRERERGRFITSDITHAEVYSDNNTNFKLMHKLIWAMGSLQFIRLKNGVFSKFMKSNIFVVSLISS